MSNGDTGFWTGSITYTPSWSASPYTVNFGQTDFSFTTTGVDWLWMSMQGWDSPPTSGSVVQRASDHGGWPTDQYFAPRTMTLTVHASASSQAERDQARAELQAAIPVNDLALLTYNEPIPKQAMVRRSGQIVETYADLTDVEFACVLVAPDPRKYTTSVKSYSAVSVNNNFGIDIPVNFATTPSPYSVGHASVSSGTTATFTVTSAVPVGAGIILTMGNENSTAQTVTASDSQGNSYTMVAHAINGGSPAESVYTLTAPITTALGTSDTITVTSTNSQAMSTIGIAIPNYLAVDTIDQVANSNSVPSVISTSPSTAQSASFVFFVNNATKIATLPTDGRGWTQFSNVTNSTLSIDSFYVNNVSTAPVNCASTYGSATTWTALSVVVDTGPPTAPNLAFTELGFHNPTTSTTWTITAGSPIPVGVEAMVQVAGANNVSGLTVSDVRGNVYSLIASTSNAVSGATMFEAVYGCTTTAPVSTGDLVTISGATSGNYMSTMYWGNVNPYTGSVVTNFGTGTTSSLSVSGVAGRVVVGIAGSLGTAGAASGWTTIGNNFGNGFNNQVFYQLSAGSSTSFSTTVSSPWLALANVFDLPPIPTLPGQTPGGSISVTNAGDFDTRPIITITGPIAGPSLTLDGAKTISFSLLTLAPGDKLVINTDSKTAMLNGSYRPSDISSGWWVLHPGTHNIQMNGTTVGGASMQVVYQDAWI